MQQQNSSLEFPNCYGLKFEDDDDVVRFVIANMVIDYPKTSEKRK